MRAEDANFDTGRLNYEEVLSHSSKLSTKVYTYEDLTERDIKRKNYFKMFTNLTIANPLNRVRMFCYSIFIATLLYYCLDIMICFRNYISQKLSSILLIGKITHI